MMFKMLRTAVVIGLVLGCATMVNASNVMQSPFWKIELLDGTIHSLRYDATGKGHYGTELLYKPAIIQSSGKLVSLTASDVLLNSDGKSLTITLYKNGEKGFSLLWPIDLGSEGFYDRLTKKTFKSSRADNPTLTSFISGATGHTIMIESFKRVKPDILNTGNCGALTLRSDIGQTVIVQTIDNNRFILDYGPKGNMKFSFNDGRLFDTINSPVGQITLRAATHANSAVKLERGEKLPYFTFGKNFSINSSTGGKTDLNHLLNEFYQQSAFWFGGGMGLVLWGEWGAMGNAYINCPYREDIQKSLTGQIIGDDGYGRDGYAYSWGDQRGWPFPDGYDTRHFIVNATQICAIRHYLMWNGNYDRISGRDFSLKGLNDDHEVFAQKAQDYTTPLFEENTYQQSFISPSSFNRIDFNLLVPDYDPVFSQKGVTYYLPGEIASTNRTPMRLLETPEQSVAQVVKPGKPFNTIGIMIATYYKTGCGGRMRAFKWTGDYDHTLQQKPLFEQRVQDFRNGEFAYIPLPEMMSAGTEILVLLDEPTVMRSGEESFTAYYYYDTPGTNELGAMFAGGKPWPDRSLYVVYGVRHLPGATFRLQNKVGMTLFEVTRDISPVDGYWSLPLGKSFPAGKYTIELKPSGAVINWKGSYKDAGFQGDAFMNGHSWDWLDRARRMMGYQMEYLNARKEYVLKYDSRCGDNDHLGLNGKSVGSGYYDILPFGYYDAYGGAWFYHSLQAMADLEKAYGDPKKAAYYLGFMQKSQARYNDLYWAEKGLKDGASRYIDCIDSNGTRHDYGFTVLNTMAITYGLAPKDRAEAILNWLDTGKTLDNKGEWHNNDIYYWGFAPRCTTIDNQDWWAAAQNASNYPWGDQIQNGGADLYESYYDLMARLKVKGADDAYARLITILRRYAEPDRLTGYNSLFTGGSVQGGQAGAVGIMTSEFPETSILASFMVYGFLGADARADGLHITPRIPSDQPSFHAENIFYHGTYFDFDITHDTLSIRTQPVEGAYDFEISGKRLHPPFAWKGALVKDREFVIKPIRRVEAKMKGAVAK